jgi:hypothetical protein
VGRAANLIHAAADQLTLVVRRKIRDGLRVGHAMTHELPVAAQARVDDGWIVAANRGIERHRATDAKLIEQPHDAPDADAIAVVGP